MTRTPRASFLLLVAALALALLTASCSSGGSEGTGSATTGPSGTTTAATGTGDSSSDHAEVRIAGLAFRPQTVTVAPGSTVTFTNEDEAAHTVDSEDDAPASFDTGRIEHGETAEVTVDEPGTYHYRCDIHPYMQGTIVVGEPES